MPPKYEPILPYRSEKPLLSVSNVPNVPGWPTTAQNLERQSILTTIWDTILCILPLFFATVGIICIKINQTLVSDLGTKMQQIILLFPTIFPITFGVTLETLIKRMSLWRLEKGISVGLLEQLQSSVALISTLQSAWFLRSFRPITLVLILIWVLSPLGGQAGLRILSLGTKPVQSGFTLYYPGPLADSIFSTGSGLESLITPTNAIFTASILAGIEVQNSFVDDWGNVKVPWLEIMNTSAADEQGWIETTQDNVTFASLVGVPVTVLSSYNNTNYTMAVSYYYINYSQAVSAPYKSYFNLPLGQVGGDQLSDFTAYQTLNFTLDPLSPETRLPYSWNVTLASLNNATTASVARCALHASNVEVNVNCAQVSCGVAYIRRSPSSPWSSESYGLNAYDVLEQELQFLPSAAGLPQHEATSGLIEGFLYNNSDVSELRFLGNWINLTLVSSSDLSVRLTQIFKTYYFASINPFYITNPQSMLDGLNISQISNVGINQTNAIGTNDQSVYILQTPWIIIWLLCICILFGAAVCNVVLGRIILAPDIIGYASSLTRDNPSISLPPGGSTLSGIERALLLREMRLKIGDAREDNSDEGSLRIRLGDGTEGLGKLDTKKLYAS